MAVGPVQVFLVTVFFTSCFPAEAYDTYYMDLMCDVLVLDMGHQRITSGVLQLPQRSEYRKNTDCWTTIRAPPGYRILIKFLEMDIHEWFGDCDDYVHIVDGSENGTALTSKLCNDHTPKMTLKSRGRNMSVYFHSDGLVETWGISLLFTAFHMGPCSSSEFECGKGYCIDARLHCDGYDNCGDDDSDTCPWEAIVGGVIGAIVGIITIIVIVVCLRRCQRRRKRVQSFPPTTSVADYKNTAVTHIQIPKPKTTSTPAYPCSDPGWYPTVNLSPTPGNDPPPGYSQALKFPNPTQEPPPYVEKSCPK